MKLSELIAKYGDDKIEFQKLDDCAIDLTYSDKKGTTIKFGTSESLHPINGTVKMGIVVWFDRKELTKILEETPHD